MFSFVFSRQEQEKQQIILSKLAELEQDSEESKFEKEKMKKSKAMEETYRKQLLAFKNNSVTPIEENNKTGIVTFTIGTSANYLVCELFYHFTFHMNL